MENRYTVYCASGWFTPLQIQTYDKVHEILDTFNNLEIYYPKEQFQFKTNTQTSSSMRQKVFNDNIQAIERSDFIVCSTEDKDPGSIFEAGYAFSINKPIIYVCFSLGNKPLNLMLQETAIAVATDQHVFQQILDVISNDGIGSTKLNQYLHKGLTE
jgi:nucleoside deoxyribosyltransferase